MQVDISKCGKSALWSLCSFVSLLILAFASSMSHADPAGKYRAFYYDAQYRLLQVEEVPEGEFDSRHKVEVDNSVMAIPLLTAGDVPLITGVDIPMSRFAVLAVYYTYDQSGSPPTPGAEDVPSLPVAVEYLGFVKDRTIATCAPRDNTDPCKFPKRCHCMTTTCCCY